MSSFVVNKSEFVKAAGLMYGIEASKQHSHRYFLENVRKRFTECYELNVESVNEQYDDESAKDGCEYDSLFEKYRQIGLNVRFNAEQFKELRTGLMQFFRSVLYQIENEEMNIYVSAFFFECTSKLFGDELASVEGWWGDVEI